MTGPARASRIGAIDDLRGLIMALMALDHVRQFFFGFAPDPTDLAATTPALFATRWITHVCAPGFALLAGMAAYLNGRGRGKASLAGFLLLRGALLVALEWWVVTFAWIPDPGRSVILLQVIWAIGWGMILLAGLVALPAPAVGAVGLGLMAAHPVLAGAVPEPWRLVLFGSGTLEAGGRVLIVSYAVLPWAGVMAAGYGLGPLIAGEPARWAPWVLALGLAAVAGFAALRWANAGGDPVPWTAGPDAAATVMAFLNVEKYPPAPLYLTVTLGLVLIGLAGFVRLGERAVVLRPLGQAPLFFYLLHLFALRATGLAAAAAVWGIAGLGPPPLPSTPEWPLAAVWAVWAAAMVPLWFATRRFAAWKRRRGGWAALF
jgi:uncharacterized membrane protein